ncbi:MinD/ParA family ATP-binding protein [Saccharopolyspora mangrovi]|uniref:AAA family ATPase n=1 Tax=Saccharopolyspora mangrovi TaxID=3082379 RepID=A0ABU6AFS3_9PSEU|nr:AAA family ATPase [Saccharopolyspora sp. S2-29]MEB3370323.1 AAA family ATPase [Saccharopolyspora sp. S2-29]
MTGQYEEPETRRNVGAAPQADGPAGTEAESKSGNGSYTEPETRPQQPKPVPEHPEPSYVDPSQPGGSGPYPVADTPQPYYPSGAPVYPDPSQSGPQPQQQWPGYPQSGPNQVSGPYPVPEGGSGPVPVSPYAPVSGGPSGPFPTGQPYPQQQPQSGPQQGPPQNPDLSSAQLLRQTKRPPQSGWRKAVYLASGKTVNLGEGPTDRRRRELITRVNQPLQGCYKIAMLSLKGGVGKTTATATLGATFASLRGDRVIAVDANPDRGTLSQKIPLETTATVRHLLRDAHRIRRYSDVRSYTSQGPSRLEILASEQDPAVSEAFSEDDYRRTVTLLEHFYNVVLTDCGTGLMHSAMKGVLDVADSLVIVSSSSIDGARSASATLDWLDAHGYGELVSRSVAVINSVRPGSGKVDVDKLGAHFGARCRAVSRIPFDPHLEEGAEVELDQLAAPTRMALLELAAMVADDFPHAPGRNQQA